MAKIPVRVKISDSEAKKIETSILDIFVDELNTRLGVGLFRIIEKIKISVGNMIRSAPEFSDLIGNTQIRAEIGLVDGASKLNDIIEIFVNGIRFDTDPFRRVGRVIKGGLTINIIREDYADVLASESASYTYYSQRYRKEVTIPWLEWLLIAGDEILVRDFKVKFGLAIEGSRTGNAVMKKDKSSAGWRVPGQYVGYPDDNFVTRALDGIEDDIYNILKNELE